MPVNWNSSMKLNANNLQSQMAKQRVLDVDKTVWVPKLWPQFNEKWLRENLTNSNLKG